MDPRDFLKTAKNLLKNDRPANCRTVFNRSYYAAYNVGVDLLEDSGIRINKNATGHGQVNNYLGNCGVREIEEIQSKLTNLANQRIKADYRLSERTVEKIKNAEKAVMTSEDIIKTFELFYSNTGKKKISNGIKVYNQKIKTAGKSNPKS